MKSTSESQIMGEFWSIEKTNYFEVQTEMEVYMYKITTFFQIQKVTVKFSITKTNPKSTPI